MIGLFGVGIYMTRISEDLIQVFQLTQSHKSFGFLVFILAVIRVLWRWVNPTPALPVGTKTWEKGAAHASHFLLYLLIFILPISGWLMSTASPLNDPGAYPTQIKNMVFGLFEMPDLFPVGDEKLSKLFGRIHEVAAFALAGLLIIHIAAALKHHFIGKNNVLRRMLPFARLR